MPVYLLHGFRWPRPLIRIHIILQNLDDAAAEWLVAPATTDALRYNFDQLYPDCMEHLDSLRFVEQYDPTDMSSDSGSQPYAYVADVVEEVKLGLDIDEVRQRGVGNDQWAAMMELRDRLAPEEKVAWYVVVCGDEERWAPPTLGDTLPKANGAVDTPVGSSEGNSVSASSTERKQPSPQQPSPQASRGSVEQKPQPRGLKKLFGSARLRKRSSRASTRDIPTRSDSSNSAGSPPREAQSQSLAVQPHTQPQDGPQTHRLSVYSDNESNLDLPSIAEAPDTSEDAIKTLREQPSTTTLNGSTFDSSARRPRSSGRNTDHRASWSSINYSAIYDHANLQGSMPNLHAGTGQRLSHHGLNVNTGSAISLQQQYHNAYTNGDTLLSPISMISTTQNGISNGNGVISPMQSFEHNRNSMRSSRHRSISPVSDAGSYNGAGRRRRKSRAPSNLSTISDQTISPDDLVARNLEFVGMKLG